MMAGLILILLAFILILIGLFVSYQVLPRLQGSIQPGNTITIDPQPGPSIPETPTPIRIAILAFCGVISLLLVVAGLWLIVSDQSHKFQIDDAIRKNQERLLVL